MVLILVCQHCAGIAFFLPVNQHKMLRGYKFTHWKCIQAGLVVSQSRGQYEAPLQFFIITRSFLVIMRQGVYFFFFFLFNSVDAGRFFRTWPGLKTNQKVPIKIATLASDSLETHQSWQNQFLSSTRLPAKRNTIHWFPVGGLQFCENTATDNSKRWIIIHWGLSTFISCKYRLISL